MERLIIDTDPGIDDAQAIMMACAYPDARVEALTVVAGNVGLERTVANACTVLDLMQADALVFPGCAQGLVHRGENSAYVHGDNGMGGAHLPRSARGIESEHAALALMRMANEESGELTLVALGPLTNLAVALKLDPDLGRKFKRLVIMGGAVHSMGNTPNLTAEFNIYADPEAAHVVFDSWPQFDLVDWEATVAHGISLDAIDQWSSIRTERGRFFRDIMKNASQLIAQRVETPRYNAADPLAMAVALEPAIVSKATSHHVAVELGGHLTRGQTVVDWSNRMGRPANASVVREVDMSRFGELVEAALR